MGALLGYVIHFNTEGIEFVMIALFVVMLVNQWEEHKDHRPALTGLVCPVICLIIFGGDNFMIPSMIFMTVSFLIGRKYMDMEAAEK